MVNHPKPSWKIRRRIIHLTLMFCAGCVLWILLSEDSRPVAEVIVMCSFGLGFTTVGSYIFGAVWDDKNYMAAVKPGGDVTPNYGDGSAAPYGATADGLGD